MSSERIKDIFARVEPLSEAERRAILDVELVGDAPARARVEALLASSDGLDDDAFAPLVDAPVVPAPPPETPERIGPYRIESLLGRGGMAHVYRAVQERPMRREVALKVVRPGFDTQAVLSRFDSERQALARLEHRNIATVLDAGADPYGPSWFAMSLVDGPPVTDFCEEQGLPFRERLRLFVQICRGVQHAHTRGILHRDLKPSNILVCREDGDAVPKIIDFGVAKALGADTPLGDAPQTLDTQIVGTLEYMSPEQARFGNPGVDARSDVYALGVILYQMLTGSVPIGGDAFRGVPLDEIQGLIQTRKPGAPSAASHINAPEDFDCVVLKALEKAADDRYESPKELADDVERYLQGLPLAIRPPTRLYVFRQFAKRNRAFLASASVVTAAVVLGLVGTSVGLLRALDREQRLEAALVREREQEEQLGRLAEFQSSRLGSTDLDAMALVLRDSLRDASGGAPGVAGIDGADFTEVARQGVAEHLLGQVVRDAEAEFGAEPLLLAAVLQDAAESAGELGLFELGLPIQDRALALWSEHAGEDHQDALDARTNRAVLLAGSGRTDEAAAIAETTAAAARATLGGDHPSTISADEVRANMLRRQGSYEEAEALYRSVVRRWAETEGATAPRTVRSTAMLGSVLGRRGKLEEAEELTRRTLTLRRASLEPDDPKVFLSRHHLGNALFRLGRHDEAEIEVRAAVDGLAATLGSRHPHTLSARGSLTTVLYTKGDTSEAIDAARTLLEVKRDAYGDEHRSTVREISNLASMLATTGAHAEAAALAEEAYGIEARMLGDQHPSTLASANTIGMAASAAGDHENAERFYRVAYEGRRAALGPDHASTLISLRNLVGQLTALERIDEAMPLAEELIERAESSLPAGHLNIEVFRIERGRARTAAGSYAAAEEDLMTAHAALSARLPPDHRFVVLAEDAISGLYTLWLDAAPEGDHAAVANRWLADR